MACPLSANSGHLPLVVAASNQIARSVALLAVKAKASAPGSLVRSDTRDDARLACHPPYDRLLTLTSK
jgi:hypothetical protein